jgi:lysophospholipase L1-like esterase
VPDKTPRARLALFSFLTVVVFFGIIEVTLRVHDFRFYFNFSADLLGMPVFDLSRFRRIANNTVEFDPRVFWKFKPNQVLDAKGVYLKPVRINNHGFRGPDLSIEKRAGSFRIACLGDSTTFGWSVGDDETYPAQLQAALKKNHPACDIEVINLGVTGYTSFQGKELFLGLAQNLKPDLVIASFGMNDRYPALLSDAEHFSAGTWQPSKIDLMLRHLQVYKLLKAGVVYAERRSQGLSLDPKSYIPKLKRKVSETDYQSNLKAISDQCGKIGCELYILNDDFPSLPADPAFEVLKQAAQKSGAAVPSGWQEWDMLKVNRELSEFAGIPLLDLRGLFSDYTPQVFSKNPEDPLKKEPWRMLMVDQGHPNKWGHQLTADRLAEMIEASPGFQKFLQDCEK